jgi:hypothetical protein
MSSSLPLLRLIAGREPGGYVELRWQGAESMRQAWWPTSQLDRVERFAVEQGVTTNIYVGAAVRANRGGGADHVARAWALWADCDTPEATERLAAFPVPPTLTVASGTPGHTHAWWSLAHPIPASLIARANRRLAFAIGADLKATDPARILRLPGTLNHKHDPPTPVTLSGGTGEIVRLSDLVADLPGPPEKRAAPASAPRTDVGPDRLLGISARTYIPALTGREVNSRGKVKCPFHGGGNERTPSLMAYADPERGWYCFGCDSSGSVYNFAGLLWGLDTRGPEFLELRARLMEELR